MKKHLPKATLSTLSEIHDESAGAAAEAASDTAAESTAEPTAEPTVSETQQAEAEIPPQNGTAMVAAGPLHSSDAELRQAKALIIVERYTTYSALGGCIPLAIFDTISVSAVVFNMVRALAEHYRVPFQRDRVKAGAAALLAGVTSPSLGSLATQLVGRLIPGAWLINTAVSSAAAAAMTRYIGQAFIDHLESGGTTLNFDMAGLLGKFRKTAAA